MDTFMEGMNAYETEANLMNQLVTPRPYRADAGYPPQLVSQALTYIREQDHEAFKEAMRNKKPINLGYYIWVPQK